MEAALGEPQPAPGPMLLSNRGQGFSKHPSFCIIHSPPLPRLSRHVWYLFHSKKNAQKNVWKDACQTLTKRVQCAWNLAF